MHILSQGPSPGRVGGLMRTLTGTCFYIGKPTHTYIFNSQEGRTRVPYKRDPYFLSRLVTKTCSGTSFHLPPFTWIYPKYTWMCPK